MSINALIDKLPVELHIPGYQYCGPGTRLRRRLARGDPGINPLDRACKEHDIAYSQSSNLADRHAADRILAGKAWERVKARDSGFKERLAALGVAGIMRGKVAIGAGLKKRKRKGKGKRKRRIVKKKGGILPLLPLLAAAVPVLKGLAVAGGIAGGASGIARAVGASQADARRLAEQVRHNKAIEKKMGAALHLGRYNPNAPPAFSRIPYRKKKLENLPRGPLDEDDIRRAAGGLKNFRGVFMRDALPKRVRANESGVVNLDDSKGPGTHWVAYKKRGRTVNYFDSYGNLRPPLEVESYLCSSSPKTRIIYNSKRYQKPSAWNCGHLALEFLY